MAPELVGRAPEPVGRAQEPAGRALEPAGRPGVTCEGQLGAPNVGADGEKKNRAILVCVKSSCPTGLLPKNH